MDEAQAREWLQRTFHVPRETIATLEAFAALLREENERQNLVSHASLDAVWSRHIADSAQLLLYAPADAATWLDLGSGAGFPGLVLAALHPARVTLVEERRLRIDFLHRASERLGLSERAEIVGRRVERLEAREFEVISARAFAPLPRLFELGTRFSTNKTRWILPKGRNAQSELEAASASWQGEFRLEPSVTEPQAWIIVAEGVRRKR